MNGKILKISNNDLYGNVDDRLVVVFAAFNHKKYMNHYVIFAFKDEYNKKKLCYGSVHFKKNVLVIFNIKDESSKGYVRDFVSQYISDAINIQEYEIYDISSFDKVELVSYNEDDCDNLELLDQKSIPPVIVNETPSEKRKPVFLYFLLFVMILLLGGVTYLYFNPEVLTVTYNKLECSASEYDNLLLLNYDSKISILFDGDNELNSFERVDTYKFDDISEYTSFKDSNKLEKVLNDNITYEYDDDNLVLKLKYSNYLIVSAYDEVYGYFGNKGYSCIEGTYDEEFTFDSWR